MFTSRVSYRLAVGLVLSLILAAMLVACGDSPANTPVPAPTAKPTTAAATTAATTAAATTAAATTAATTAAATTAAPTTVAATTAAATTAASGSMMPAGLTELTLGKEIEDYYAKQYAILGITKADLKAYVSDETPEKLAQLADSTVTAQGYKFDVTGQTKPFTQGKSILGLYSKAGEPDILFQVSDPGTPDSSLKAAGISDASIAAIQTQVNGKKSAILITMAPGIIKAFMAANSPSTTPASTAPASVPLVKGITAVTLEPAVEAALVKALPGGTNAKVQVYAADAEADALASDLDANFSANGFKWGLPGSQTKPFSSGGSVVGYYSLPNGADAVFSITPIVDASKALASTSVDAATAKNFTDQLQGKKNLLIVFSGNGLIKSVISATSGSATTAAATTAASSAGASATIPADLTLSGNTALSALDKLTTASSNIQSVKMTMTGSISASGQTASFSMVATVVKPDKLSLNIDAAGQKIGVVLIGSDSYINATGTWQKVTDPAAKAQFAQSINQLNDAALSKDQLKKFAGSTVTIMPDEKLDGQDVGVIEVDTSKSQDADLQKLGKIVYKFDNQFRIVQAILKTPQGDFNIRMTDYDSPNNTVTAPNI